MDYVQTYYRWNAGNARLSENVKMPNSDPEKHKENCRRWYEANREYRLQYVKDARKRHRYAVLDYYSNGDMKCICCGEPTIEFLTIDHIAGGGEQHKRQIAGFGKFCGSSEVYRWLIKNNFPKGYQVLCYNCNCGRQVNGGVCPHQVIRSSVAEPRSHSPSGRGSSLI